MIEMDKKIFEKLYGYVKSGEIKSVEEECNPFGDYPCPEIFGEHDDIDKDVEDLVGSWVTDDCYSSEYINIDDHSITNRIDFRIKRNFITYKTYRTVVSKQSFSIESINGLKEYICSYVQKKVGESISFDDITCDMEEGGNLEISYFGLAKGYPEEEQVYDEYELKLFKYFKVGFWKITYKYLEQVGIKRKDITVIDINQSDNGAVYVHWDLSEDYGKDLIMPMKE